MQPDKFCKTPPARDGASGQPTATHALSYAVFDSGAFRSRCLANRSLSGTEQLWALLKLWPVPPRPSELQRRQFRGPLRSYRVPAASKDLKSFWRSKTVKISEDTGSPLSLVPAASGRCGSRAGSAGCWPVFGTDPSHCFKRLGNLFSALFLHDVGNRGWGGVGWASGR